MGLNGVVQEMKERQSEEKALVCPLKKSGGRTAVKCLLVTELNHNTRLSIFRAQAVSNMLGCLKITLKKMQISLVRQTTCVLVTEEYSMKKKCS